MIRFEGLCSYSQSRWGNMSRLGSERHILVGGLTGGSVVCARAQFRKMNEVNRGLFEHETHDTDEPRQSMSEFY